MTSASSRPVALITGATGGMGRATARRLGQRYDLFLTDLAEDRLAALVQSLTDDGYPIAGTFAGDFANETMPAQIVAATRAAGPLGAVFHAAGLGPVQAEPAALLRLNLLATEHLLRAIETDLEPGLVAVLVASMAAHAVPVTPELRAAALDPLRPGFLEDVLPHLCSLPDLAARGFAYGISKRAVVDIAESRAALWGRAGARIVSISPGLIDTPMGRAEVGQNEGAAATLHLTPLGWGRAMDIAALVAFLCSEDARFITGCDIRVDGGVTPVVLASRNEMSAIG